VTVGAALAKEGLEVWIYSIAPFVYARAFEQIRNDICLHGLPVRLLGNGGGYGYGVMGATHHALEDYGILLTLPGMRVFTPVFNEDIENVVTRAGDATTPSYIRLGRGERPAGAAIGEYASWRRLIDGDGPVVMTIGPMGGAVQKVMESMKGSGAALWVVAELPFDAAPIPEALIERIAKSGRLCVIEEHVAQGGLGSMICRRLAEADIPLHKFRHLYAKGYPSGRYGSQNYMRAQGGLDPVSIQNAIADISSQ
jgi:transketolase